jgi:hypothetical protein
LISDAVQPPLTLRKDGVNYDDSQGYKVTKAGKVSQGYEVSQSLEVKQGVSVTKGSREKEEISYS